MVDCKNKANLPTKDVTNYFHGDWHKYFCSCIGMGGRCCLVLPDLSKSTVGFFVRLVSAGVLCTVHPTVTGTYRFAGPQTCLSDDLPPFYVPPVMRVFPTISVFIFGPRSFGQPVTLGYPGGNGSGWGPEGFWAVAAKAAGLM